MNTFGIKVKTFAKKYILTSHESSVTITPVMNDSDYTLIRDVTGKLPEKRGPQVIEAYGCEIKIPHPPKKNCKKCYGRGYVGFNDITKQVAICRKCYPII